MNEERERPGPSSGGAPPPASRQDVIKQLGPYLGLGWTLAISVGLGLAGGYYADRWLDTEPWLMLTGIAIGMGVGFTAVLRTALGASRPDHDDH